MNTSNVYKRGQVWHWIDPTYGAKQNHKTIPMGEGGYHYNRYVLIVSNTDSIGAGPVTVIPLSSHKTNPGYDIPIHIDHLYSQSISHAKTKFMFSAHLRMLDKYICTIGDEDMKRVDAILIKTICPFIQEAMDDKEILDRMGIDMNALNPNLTTIPDIYDTAVRNFIASHVRRSGNMDDIVKIQDMKNAFDIYCMNHLVPVDQDTLRFLNTFMQYTNSKTCGFTNWRIADASMYTMTELRGLTLDPNLKLVINFEVMKEDEEALQKYEEEKRKEAPKATLTVKKEEEKIEPPVVQRKDTNNRIQWTEENKIAFCRYYDKVGREQCAKDYNISTDTCRLYYGKWKKEFKDRITEESQKEVEHDTSINTDGIITSISGISNLMNLKLRELNAYKVSPIPLNDSLFYDKVGNAIFNSLLDYMGIKEVDKCQYQIPNDLSKQSLKTYKFFDVCFHDKRIFGSPNIDEICARIDQIYGTAHPDYGTIRIGNKWLSILNNKLLRNNIPQKHRDSIVNYLRPYTK